MVNGMDAYKNMKDAKKHETGADHHRANKKAKTKGSTRSSAPPVREATAQPSPRR
ncbi:hypothetical protein ACFQ60_26505 [Streptomyces zhihengii]